jgi:hypothetical protein
MGDSTWRPNMFSKLPFSASWCSAPRMSCQYARPRTLGYSVCQIMCAMAKHVCAAAIRSRSGSASKTRCMSSAGSAASAPSAPGAAARSRWSWVNGTGGRA